MIRVSLSKKIWSIAPGDAVNVTCTGTGSPKPDEVKWFKGDSKTKLTSADEGYTVTTTSTTDYNLISTLAIASQDEDQVSVTMVTRCNHGNQVRFNHGNQVRLGVTMVTRRDSRCNHGNQVRLEV
eukprot:sb/3475665/